MNAFAAVVDAKLERDTLPVGLRAIPDPPRRLFCRGNADVLAQPAVAIVGSRRCSRQGREVAFALARDLAGQGLNVVSGLAYGIDAAAHEGALAAVRGGGDRTSTAGAGVTIAVLGSGLRRIYPAAHTRLAADILAAGGVLVTEHEPSSPPRKHHFPARNRIVSGLCLGVVIVEASAKSGSLITARLALEQGRDVMAVPSLVSSPLSAGCHRLIREGAALVECAEHVLEVLGVDWRGVAVTPEPKGETADPVLAEVGAEITSVDAISAQTGLPLSDVLSRLAELEIDGLVCAAGGGYVRTRR